MSIGRRLFLTCWIIYALHFATNIVREIYLGVSLGEHGSFRVDEYAGLHPDLFEKKGYGWHINNNPGASVFGSIPYFVNRWWIEPVSESVKTKRIGAEPPSYDSPWPMAREFYAEAWRRGFDLKLGLAALVMQIFCMAPISAFGVVLMFHVLKRVLRSERAGLWLSLLYAFGTPIFFRTGTLNQNLLTAHAIFTGFVLLWNPEDLVKWALRTRMFLAGIAGGICVLLDSSGVVLLAILFAYALRKTAETQRRGERNLTSNLISFCCGIIPPILLLGFYQWKSFGNPIYPAQYYMPAQNPYAEAGFHGFGGIQPKLLWALLFDYRYGLFLSCAILCLSFFVFWIRKSIARLELWFIFVFFAAMWLFFSGVNYTHLQFNTGIRYLITIVPFLFVPTAMVLNTLPRKIAVVIGAISVIQSWCLAMYRDVERGAGIAEPVIRIFTEGPQLPALTTLSRMEGFKNLPFGILTMGVFLITGVVLYVIWHSKQIARPLRPGE